MVNDYYREFKNCKVIAQVYDIDSKKVFEESATINLPSDGVANDALTIRFPENISQVHFIKLILKDEKGKDISSNFYWLCDKGMLSVPKTSPTYGKPLEA